MKRMESENDKIRRGIWNDIKQYINNQNHDPKSFKRQKSPAKSLFRTNEIKEQFMYKLKPGKCSYTDITKSRTPDVLKISEIQLRRNKFFNDATVENIFMNSEYFKMKFGSVSSVSFCNRQNVQNQYTTDAKKRFNSRAPSEDKDFLYFTPYEVVKSNEEQVFKRARTLHGEEDLNYVKENLNIMMGDVKMMKRDLCLVKMHLKTIEKLTSSINQFETCKTDGVQNDEEDINFSEFSDEAEKTAQELRDFIESKKIQTTPDFDRIISNLQTLSEIAYEPKIIKTSNGAKFEIPKEFPVSLYQNGILLRNMEFRKYADIMATTFLRDIEDGFFPRELWWEYPHGVPFQVTDRRFEKYYGDADFANRFPGTGRRLGSSLDCKPSSTINLESDNLDWTCHRLMNDKKTKKKSKNPSSSQDRNKNSTRGKITVNNKPTKESEEIPLEADSKLMSIKVRLANETEIIINVMSNKKMKYFQEALFRELCDYHDDHFKNTDINKRRYSEMVPDFEVHMYGQKSFRLSECVDHYPSECGIVNNCVINITEI